jgi:hypothetical protein
VCKPVVVERVRVGADLVYFDQNRVADAFFDSLAKEGDVGHEEIIPDELHLLA